MRQHHESCVLWIDNSPVAQREQAWRGVAACVVLTALGGKRGCCE
jgi:hypothetical protein